MRFFNGRNKGKEKNNVVGNDNELALVGGLPNEIWENIFQYLDIQGLLRQQLVCKDFATFIANNNTLVEFIKNSKNKHDDILQRTTLIKSADPGLKRLAQMEFDFRSDFRYELNYQKANSSISDKMSERDIRVNMEDFNEVDTNLLKSSMQEINKSNKKLELSRKYSLDGLWSKKGLCISILIGMLLLSNISIIMKEYVFNSKGNMGDEFLLANITGIGVFALCFAIYALGGDTYSESLHRKATNNFLKIKAQDHIKGPLNQIVKNSYGAINNTDESEDTDIEAGRENDVSP